MSYTIKKRTTITIETVTTDKSYPGQSLVEALAEERGTSFNDKIQAFKDVIDYVPDDKIWVSEEFTTVTGVLSEDGS